jgi:dihydrofolate reductase
MCDEMARGNPIVGDEPLARPPVSIRPNVVRVEGETPAQGRRHTREDEMSKIVVFNSLTRDGVMQAPGRPDEDRRGGFEHGGWAQPYMDAVMGEVAAQGMAEGGPILFGRRTYEDFFSYWPHQTDNPFTEVLDNSQKYVASRTLHEPLPWQNSTLLKGDVAEAVVRLREEPGKDIVVLGSGDLLQSLIRHGLVDEYMLLVHPLVLGSGRRLFPDGGSFARLRLVDSVTTTTGVIIATYRPTEASAAQEDLP